MRHKTLKATLKESGSPLCLMLAPILIVCCSVTNASRAEGRPNLTDRLACRNGVVYVGTAVGQLTAVDIAQRKVLWTLHDSNLEAFLDPVLFNDHAIFLASTREGSELMSLDRITGKTLWRRRFVEVASPSSPALCDGRLLLNDYHKGQEIALDPSTGRQVWSSDRVPFRLAHPPGIDGKYAWFMAGAPNEDAASKLLQLDCSDGSVRQPIPITGPIENVSYHPVVLWSGDALLSGDRMETQPGSIILLSLDRHEVLWRVPFYHRMDYAPAVEDGRLIGSIWSIDLATGKELFNYSPQPGESASFCVWDHLLLYQRASRTLAAVDINKARKLWTRTLPFGMRSNLALCGEVVCVETVDRRLALLNPSDGSVFGYVPLAAKASR